MSSTGTASAYDEEVIEKCLLRLKYGYFSDKMHVFATGGLHSTPEPCEAHFIMDARALFHVFWTVKEKHPPTTMIELRSAKC